METCDHLEKWPCTHATTKLTDWERKWSFLYHPAISPLLSYFIIHPEDGGNMFLWKDGKKAYFYNHKETSEQDS